MNDVLLLAILKAQAAGDTADDVLQTLAAGLTNRLIHQPTARLREASVEGRSELIGAARELLGLGEPGDST